MEAEFFWIRVLVAVTVAPTPMARLRVSRSSRGSRSWGDDDHASAQTITAIGPGATLGQVVGDRAVADRQGRIVREAE